MASKPFYPMRDDAVGQTLLMLRSRARLTQAGLADRLGIHRRSVQKWESSETYPTAENLRALITVLLPLDGFIPGRERDEAADLWQQVSQAAPQPLPDFDTVWFDQLLVDHHAGELNDKGQSSSAVSPSVSPSLIQGGYYLTRDLLSPSTPLVGREAELAELAGLLRDPACRLVTLFGPGGIGKTRLALAVAAGQTDIFSDGVAVVALASIGSPNQIAAAIGEVLQLSFVGQSDPTSHLLAYLHQRHMLLVLDNFEHLLAGTALIADILTHTSRITILITSRERTNLLAESLFDVGGLTYPTADTAASQPQPNLTNYSAIQLFVQRAGQVQPGFAPSASTLTAISHICRHVAGMPLAIELAAAGARLLPIVEIERQIRSNLDLLTTSLRDVPTRHRSLRAVFDQSWNLLSEPERVCFSRLAVFRGGWTAIAAEQVARATSPTLAALVDKSLVRQSQGGSGLSATRAGAAESRFVLLEPIREYALEKLSARGELETLQRAHAAYCLTLAEAVSAQWDSPTAATAIEQLDHEYDNMRAALQWACENGDPTIGLQLAGALRKFWQRRGYYSEGRKWLEELLALDDPILDTVARTARLQGLHTAAWLASDQHDFDRARLLFEQNLALRRAWRLTEDETDILAPAARQARAVGQYRRATELLEDALARQRARGDRGSASTGGLGQSFYELALVLREQGDFVRAADLFEEGLAFHRTIGEREGIAIGLMGLADVARDQGDAAQLRYYSQQSLAISRELDIQWAIGFGLNNLALAAYLEDDLPQALALINESAALFRSINNDGGRAEILVTMGYILQAQEKMAAAREALTEALRLAEIVGPRLLMAAALEGLAHLAAQSGQAVLAVRLLSAASTLRTQMGTPLRPADQPAIERLLATTRSILGTDAFAAIWAGAADLSPEQILSTPPNPASPPLPTSPGPTEILPNDNVMPAPQRQTRVDWGLAQDVPALYGRVNELATLTQWAIEDHCRVITLVGIGGIGKTSLAITFARQIAPHFDTVVFRSLGEAPPLSDLLDQLIHTVAARQIVAPPQISEKLPLLIGLLREERCLLILDNLETLLQAGGADRPYLPGYEGYSGLFQRLGETAHQSCIILTSREWPRELTPLEGPQNPVRSLRVTGLPEEACRALLADQALIDLAGDAAALARRYAGNPLALKLVTEPIRALFNGDIATFLSEGYLFFNGVGQLLAQQISRASPLEQTLLTWLAIGREPISLDRLMADLTDATGRSVVLAALQALWRRNLIERGSGNLTFTLQRVVLEYLTEHLVERAVDEIRQGNLDHFCRHALIQATVKEYVRHTQERLIATPLLDRLTAAYGSIEAVEHQLLTLLTAQRDQPPPKHGYGPGNLINLLRLLRGHLRGLDLTRLAIRQAYLQGVEVQDTNLADAVIRDSVFTETFDVILAVAIRWDGEYWAASGRRGEIWLWTGDGLTLHRGWRAHLDMVWGLAFSPDGQLLASGSWDGRVKLWEVASGSLLWSGRHSGHINSLAFAPDGSLLASGGNDATLRLWDIKTGLELQTLSQPGPISVVTWSPDGHFLAGGDVEGSIRLWVMNKTESAIWVRTLVGHTTWVDGLAFAPDGNTLASASWDGAVKLWDTSTLRPDSAQTAPDVEGSSQHLRQTLTGHTDRVNRVAWSPDGRTLASSSRDRTIWLWDIEQGSYRAALQGHTAAVYGLAFTADSRNLLSGSDDGTLRLWEIASGQCMRVLHGRADFLYVVDWNPDGTRLISGGTDMLVMIWDIVNKTPPKVLRGHGGLVCGVGWSSDGRWLASSEWDNAIRLWDATSGICRQIIRHPNDTDHRFYDLTWSPDGTRLAGGTNRRRVQVFEVAAAKQRWDGRSFPTLIRHVAWSPDGSRLAGGGDDGVIYVWDVAGDAPPQRLVGHPAAVKSIAWSPDGSWLASSSSGRDGGELFVWKVQSGERIGAFIELSGIVSAVAWGLSENVVVSGGGDGRLRWWDVSRGECVQVGDAYQGTIQSLRRSPDGTKLASCGDDVSISLWDLRSGDHLQTLRRDRPYERLNITGIRGLTDAQRTALMALGAVQIQP